MNNAYIKPTTITKVIIINKVVIKLLFNERILFGKNFLNIKTYYI